MRTFSPEQIRIALQSAPPPIQEVFVSEVTSQIIFDLKQKYRLHVDTAGELGHQIGFLLIGLITPSEFFGNIMLSGTDEKTARGIMEEMNERIFLPLKRQMSQAPAPPAMTTTPSAQSLPQEKPVLVPPPALDYVAPPATLPGSPEIAPMPVNIPPAVIPTVSAAPVKSFQPVAQTPVFQTPASPTPPQPTPTPLTKDFGADPYREAL